MKSVVLCEGGDDLWFISYYLYKKAHWDIDQRTKGWKTYQLNVDKKQSVNYMVSATGNQHAAIVSVGGQDRFKAFWEQVLKLNENFPFDPITSIIFFRDRDDRSPETVVSDMEDWFPNTSLGNMEVSQRSYVYDDDEIKMNILPIVIPVDECGAIETLLLEAIGDNGDDGAYIADSAREYIDKAVDHKLTEFLKHQREITKAKFSAAVAITNPDHSTKRFQELVMSVAWEQSKSVEKIFKPILDLISK